MPDEYKQTQRIEHLHGNATYNYHHHEAPTRKPFRPGKWGLLGGGLVAVLGLGGTLVTTQLNARPVFYCASHNTVKYHTDRNCPALEQCGGRVRSMPLSRAESKMDLCRVCH